MLVYRPGGELPWQTRLRVGGLFCVVLYFLTVLRLLKQLVSGPTRNSATLDKIFTNIASWFQSPVILPAVTKSDHNTVLLTPSDSPQRPKQQRIKVYRRISDSSRKTLLCHYIMHLNWSPLFLLPDCASMISCFYSVILSSLDFFLPVISITKWSTDKPWVTPKFRELAVSYTHLTLPTIYSV